MVLRTSNTVSTVKPYDLQDRTFQFALNCREFCKAMSQTTVNRPYIAQLVRASGSVGANYIESKEALGLKDQQMRLRIARKEAKEAVYWLRLLDVSDNDKILREELTVEGKELIKILSSILGKTKQSS